MKRSVVALFFLMLGFVSPLVTSAQCSICTKTAMQLGEGPAKGLNQGILYLMATPLIIMAVIGYRWWKREKQIS